MDGAAAVAQVVTVAVAFVGEHELKPEVLVWLGFPLAGVLVIEYPYRVTMAAARAAITGHLARFDLFFNRNGLGQARLGDAAPDESAARACRNFETK